MPIQISDEARELIWTAERTLTAQFCRADAVEAVAQQRVLEAFQAERVSARHFAPTNGYGYDDIGRDTLDRVFARALMAEAALVRPQIASGTHAIYLAVAGAARAGDTVLSATGKPYDTLEQAFGLRGDAPGSLAGMGVRFREIALKDDAIDVDAVCAALNDDPSARIVFLQRSRGYSWRNAIGIGQLARAIGRIREARADAVVIVDNCYGEFTEAREPSCIGADLVAGSLIKNPGGGLAPTGGYVTGRADLVDAAAQRLTIPGLGAEVGSYESSYRPFYQGLFLAPHVTAQCVKTALLFARVFESLDYETMPSSREERSDIIQAIRFDGAEELLYFCRAVQAAAPIDSFVLPEPWDMPGYQHPVVMAAGTFVQGATTELSADAPMREPYTAYVQGALTYAHGRLAAMLCADAIVSKQARKTGS